MVDRPETLKVTFHRSHFLSIGHQRNSTDSRLPLARPPTLNEPSLNDPPMTTRRNFLAATAASFTLPTVFQRMAAAAPELDQRGAKDTILVIVQLTGGNDGLNTVVPSADPIYQKARPTLKIPNETVLKLQQGLGLAPTMKGFSTLWEASQLAIIQGVGYAQPNRSHFESMDIWHKATMSPAEKYGWLGRSAPELGGAGDGVLHIGDGEPPLAVYGATGYAPSMRSMQDFQLKTGTGAEGDRRRVAVQSLAEKATGGDDLLSFVQSSAKQSFASAARIREVAAEYKTGVDYPQTPLAQRLKLIAQLIDAQLPQRVYYVSHDGFDTHAGQAISHGQLLGTLATAMQSFHTDLKEHGHAERVTGFVFSEFGRRVAENGSAGTDHGTAAPVFLTGASVKGGLHGAHPSLENLDDGDVKFHTDFRSVYATLLQDVLGVDPGKVLTGQYPTLPVIRRG